MKIWEKGIELDKKIEAFTIGRDKEFDLLLAPYDVIASVAHAEMLHTIDLLTLDELRLLRHALSEIQQRIAHGQYQIEEGVEDIHSQIELDLIRQIGEVGKKIHAGRSRNDQVAVCLQLFFRDQIKQIKKSMSELIDSLLEMADVHKEKLFPGYTHTQIGMVSSFGLWFAAYAESLVQDHNYLSVTAHIIDQNPLGSAAGYGNSFPLDRDQTTRDLEFNQIAINPIFAQMTRSKSELLIGNVLSSMAFTLGKLASDVCSFCSANYNFISLPDQITTGSSIMPHKKNPDVFELIRAKCNQLMTTPNQVMMLINNLMHGYHRDAQSLKEIIIPALDMAQDVLAIAREVIPLIEPKSDLLDDPKYDHLYSVEKVNQLVIDGVPFRAAYKQVAQSISDGSFMPPKDLKHTHIGSLGNLGLELIRQKLKK